MSEFIKVPEKVTGVRFIGEIPEKANIGYDTHRLFHQIDEGWHVLNEVVFKATRNPFYQGHLDPVNAQLIIGLDDEIAQNYVYHQSLRSTRIGNDWGTGNLLRGLYTLTKQDIESRLGNNEVTTGKVNPPLEPGTLLSHRISKNNLRAGDKVICMRHSGDHFFYYQLLREVADDLVAMLGMNFGSYTLSGPPIQILKVKYTQQERR